MYKLIFLERATSERHCSTAYGSDIEKGYHLLHPERWGWGHEGYGSKAIQEFGVETTLDWSCSGQRMAISLQTLCNQRYLCAFSARTKIILK